MDGQLKLRRLAWSGILAGWAVGTSPAQGPAPVVEAKVLMATDAAHANSMVKVAAVAYVASGYHINDHHPSLDYLIPTELKLEPVKEIVVKDVVYPKGEPKRFAFSDTPLSVYEGTVVVGAILQVERAVPPGTYTLKGKLSYQACNDHACLPPANAPLNLMLRVVGRGVALKPANADVFERIQFQ